MSVSGTFLVVFTASFLKPLLSTNQSLQSPSSTIYDQYTNVSPFEDANMDSEGVTNLFLTLRLPQLWANTMESELDMKRQFDPWGGKRRPKSAAEEDIDRKRQFSPWGGKRSMETLQTSNVNSADEDSKFSNVFNSGNKRGFNSWGGKRSFNSWGGKRNSKAKDLRRNFNSWGGKRGFNSWGGKRNFNAWGGKRSESDLNENSELISFNPKKNANLGRKRQGFNSWGGKRSFNSWGGKRNFNSWGGKRTISFDKVRKEPNISNNNRILSTKNAILEERERNMH